MLDKYEHRCIYILNSHLSNHLDDEIQEQRANKNKLENIEYL